MRHLIFLFVDHFEPGDPSDLEAWAANYPRMAGKFADARGRPPRHTWFYDATDPAVLNALGALCRAGYGEIELHLHHAFDTPDGFREKIETRKRLYAEHGALITSGPKPVRTFGFIHGKWSLDNSRGDAHCGVNNELQLLRETGCYADFTFPAWGAMQPSMKNAIYYAADDPARPKSYDTGRRVAVGEKPSGDLMIFQGPGRLSGVPPKAARIPGLAWLADRLMLTCGVAAHQPATPSRIDRWVKANVHVAGQPEWVFVKVHAHGAREADFDAVFGQSAAAMHEYLNRRYNDGVNWRLHYVTAREAFNIVKAAEAGRTGDPDDYRDFGIAPYRNTMT